MSSASSKPGIGFGISPARGPPLWEDCDAQTDEGVLQIEPDWATDWDGAAQRAPDYEVDQRVSW